MSIGFGKHDSVESVIGYSAVLDGWSNDSLTFGEETGDWADRLDGSVTVENLVSLFGADYRAKLVEELSHGGYGHQAGHHGFDQEDEDSEHSALIDDVLESLATCAGIIITGNDQGFVYGESFNTTNDLQREWTRLQGIADDVYREQLQGEHDEWAKDPRYSSHDQETDCPACAPEEE